MNVILILFYTCLNQTFSALLLNFSFFSQTQLTHYYLNKIMFGYLKHISMKKLEDSYKASFFSLPKSRQPSQKAPGHIISHQDN